MLNNWCVLVPYSGCAVVSEALSIQYKEPPTQPLYSGGITADCHIMQSIHDNMCSYSQFQQDLSCVAIHSECTPVTLSPSPVVRNTPQLATTSNTTSLSYTA